MDTPGITVRPIKNMSGGAMFAEVFFDDVRVPVENRLGDEGQGWQVTVSALAARALEHRRGPGLIREARELKELAQETVRGGRRVERGPGRPPADRAGETKIEAMRPERPALPDQAAEGRAARQRDLDQQAPSRAELEVELGELALEILGSGGHLMGREAPAVDEGRWAAASRSPGRRS